MAARHYLVNRADRHLFDNRVCDCYGCLGYAQYQVIAGALQVVYLLVMIPIRVKLQTYNAGWLLLAQDENRSAWAATREASWASAEI